ncbi:DUF1906 domain-containing protein [Paenibacillus humicus]|uniref:DUF1906 domain-containing protein n=1 Tax=Paenibacillus humicus TaxID=412861 RepID=UPI003F1873FB
MPAKGFDCATPVTAQVAAALVGFGLRYAARYLVPESHWKWKRLSQAESLILTNAGLEIVSVFETSASRPRGGAASGTEDGKLALAEAKVIGQPEGSAIYFAVDYDAKSSDFDSIEAYLRAAAKEIPGYRIGVYGSYAVVEAMAKRKAALHFWQTYAWSGGKESAFAHIFQYSNGRQLGGTLLDLNNFNGGEGAWSAKVVKPPNRPAELTPKIIRGGKLVAVGSLVDGRLHGPLADVLEAAGIKYKWDNETKKLYLL